MSQQTYPVTQWVRAAAPGFEPISPEEARNQLCLGDNTAHTLLINGLIQSARETVENDTGIICATGSFSKKFTEWGDGDYMELRGIRPISSVTSIAYLDTGGVSTTWGASNYSLESSLVVPAVKLAYSGSWPASRGDLNSITVTVAAGYATAAFVPAMFKQACLLLISHWFENRGLVGQVGPEIAMAYDALVNRLGRSTYP